MTSEAQAFLQATTTFPIETLRGAFDAISDPKDWRGPISALIPPDAFRLFAEAVDFLTATTLRIVGGPEPLTGRILVEADGYRNGPAGC